MSIESKRTVLRRFSESDLGNLIELESDGDVMQFTGPGMALPEQRIKERMNKLLLENDGSLGVWAAEFKDNHDFIGWFMLKKSRFEDPELGFMLVKRHWGKGLATEISQTLVNYGFSLREVKKIVATTHPENAASIRVLEKIGMTYQKATSFFNANLQKEIPSLHYEMLKSKYSLSLGHPDRREC